MTQDKIKSIPSYRGVCVYHMLVLALRGALARSSKSADSSHVCNASHEATSASARLGERPVPAESERCSAAADGLQLQQGPCKAFGV